jgi:hypothetical protein
MPGGCFAWHELLVAPTNDVAGPKPSIERGRGGPRSPAGGGGGGECVRDQKGRRRLVHETERERSLAEPGPRHAGDARLPSFMTPWMEEVVTYPRRPDGLQVEKAPRIRSNVRQSLRQVEVQPRNSENQVGLVPASERVIFRGRRKWGASRDRKSNAGLPRSSVRGGKRASVELGRSVSERPSRGGGAVFAFSSSSKGRNK